MQCRVMRIVSREIRLTVAHRDHNLSIRCSYTAETVIALVKLSEPLVIVSLLPSIILSDAFRSNNLPLLFRAICCEEAKQMPFY